jgi:hypothetical protein
MPQKDGPRLDGRNGEIWRGYLLGRTQEALADEHGIAQQRVSQILAEVRDALGTDDLATTALVDLERLDLLLSAYMPGATRGDTKAGGLALKVLERKAKALGTDATEPLTVLLTRRTEDSGRWIGDVLGKVLVAVLDAATDDPTFRRALAQYASLLTQRELLSDDPTAELPAVPEPPQRPAPAPPADPPHVIQPSAVMPGREQPALTVAEMLADYEATYGPLGGEEGDDDDADQA